MNIKAIIETAIYVADLEEIETFYGTILGLRVSSTTTQGTAAPKVGTEQAGHSRYCRLKCRRCSVTSEAIRMKIATWNLESRKPLTADFERAFRKVFYGLDADVWVVTETWLNFSLVGYQLVAQTGQADDLIHAKRPFSRWVAIWSRLKARKLEVLSDPERMACIRVEEGNRPVVIVGTVLPWGGDERHPPKQGTPKKDAAAAEFCQMLQIQSAEWRQWWSNTDKTGFCVAGDFNQESLFFPNPKSNKRHTCINQAFNGLDCLTNKMKVVYPKAKQHLNPHPTIDHICVGGGLKLRDGTTPTTWDVPKIDGKAITDHAGVGADLTF